MNQIQDYKNNSLTMEKSAQEKNTKKESPIQVNVQHQIDQKCQQEQLHSQKNESQFSVCSFQRTKDEKICKKYFEKEALIKNRIYQRIRNAKNRKLFPQLMGPHPIYTTQLWDKSDLSDFQMMDLKQELLLVLKEFWNSRLGIIKNKKHPKAKKQRSQQEAGKTESRGKYKKYTLQFKKGIVERIQRQFSKQGPDGRSLRHFIVKESELLKIHPKNISRWISSDLDKTQGGRLAKYPVLEYRLQQFISQYPDCERRTIIKQAMRLKDELGYSQKFKFSKGWFQRFRNRMRQKKVGRTIQRLISEQVGKNTIKQKPIHRFVVSNNFQESKPQNINDQMQSQGINDEV